MATEDDAAARRRAYREANWPAPVTHYSKNPTLARGFPYEPCRPHVLGWDRHSSSWSNVDCEECLQSSLIWAVLGQQLRPGAGGKNRPGGAEKSLIQLDPGEITEIRPPGKPVDAPVSPAVVPRVPPPCGKRGRSRPGVGNGVNRGQSHPDHLSWERVPGPAL